MDLGGRKCAIKTLVGSHNYNLNDEKSDRDFKIFTLPTFQDLYDNKMFSTSKIGEYEDYDVHDIRKLTNLLFKSNINFVEVLFSRRIDINRNINNWEVLFDILNMKEDIARMNLPYFYKACIGMYHNKMKYLDKGTGGTQDLVEKYGYCTKNAMHAYRVLDFLVRYARGGFVNFNRSIEYNDSERGFMLSIKYGKYTREEFIELIEEKKKFVEGLKIFYMAQHVDEDLKSKLKSMIKELVRVNM